MNDIYQTVYFRNNKLGVNELNSSEMLEVNGNSKLKVNLDISGNTTIKDISGNDASFNNIYIKKDANIDNNAFFGINLEVGGKTTIKDISGSDFVLTIFILIAIYFIDNNVNIGMDLDVTGNTTIKDISGSDASFNNIDIINGNANIDNNDHYFYLI